MLRGGDRRSCCVAYVNNARVDLARTGWAAGLYPDHHLYGSNYLAPEVVVEDWTISGTAARRGSSLGPWGPQLRLLATRPDVLYSANLGACLGLALATGSPLSGTRLVSICHTSGASSNYLRALTRVLSTSVATIALSAARADELQRLAPRAQIASLAWGPDLAFEPFREIAARQVRSGALVSTGKTYRDTPTVLAALARLGPAVPALVVVDPSSPVRAPHASVTVVEEPSAMNAGGATTYGPVLPLLQKAQAVAIPLADTGPYIGLTELIDALACGLPVIHTQSPHLDIDVERIGCGIRVPAADVTGWAAAIEEVMSDPVRAHTMGQRGREWVEQNCSSKRFGGQVRQLVSAAAG